MSGKKIIVRQSSSQPSCFSQNTPDILRRIYRNRGITDESQLNSEISALLPFTGLLNIEKAASLLSDAIQSQKRFLFIGDYDADGATSTALGVSALKKFGAKHVNYLIPNRFEFGYGLTPDIVNVAIKHDPDVLITVDNGISSHAGVDVAKAHGIKVIITDHHLAGLTLPKADVIVNPNQPGDVFLSKSLAGVGVIFYVMLALRSELRERNWFLHQQIAEPNMTQFLDLVALGTVADVVSLDQNNRVLVQQGLKRIRAGLGRHGIQALLQVSKRNAQKIAASDLGFAVGPRLNAAGRLDDMSLGVACLLSDRWWDALQMASQLDALNQERRVIEDKMLQEADSVLEKFSLQTLPYAISLYEAKWHQGVIGILAGRIKDRYNRPTVVFAKVNENELKGSARSIVGCHLRDILALIDTQHPSLIEKFGGHAMAAGLTIKENNFLLFKEIFNQTILNQLTPDLLQNILPSDGELLSEEFTIDTANLIREAGPWGQGFPEPVFNGSFTVIEQHIINGKHLKLYIKPFNANNHLEAIVFNLGAPLKQEIVQIAYRLDINEFAGNKKLQLIVEHIE